MKKVARSNLLEDLPTRIVDDSAQTAAELAISSGYSIPHMQVLVRTNVAKGRWERVYKHVGNRLTPAYRRKET